MLKSPGAIDSGWQVDCNARSEKRLWAVSLSSSRALSAWYAKKSDISRMYGLPLKDAGGGYSEKTDRCMEAESEVAEYQEEQGSVTRVSLRYLLRRELQSLGRNQRSWIWSTATNTLINMPVGVENDDAQAQLHRESHRARVQPRPRTSIGLFSRVPHSDRPRGPVPRLGTNRRAGASPGLISFSAAVCMPCPFTAFRRA